MISNYVFLGLLVLGPAVQASPELAQQKGCMACHAMDKKLVGPAFRDVAKRYADRPAQDLARSIRAGGSGRWGPVPMPAQPHVTEAEARSLATWIMGSK